MSTSTPGAVDLSGRTALVTGAGSGMGHAIAKTLAAAGAKVTAADLDSDAAHKVAEEIGGEAWVVDLSDVESLEELSLDCDILVNCAGIQRVHAIEEFPAAQWRFIHRLMLEAPFLLTRAALPHMTGQDWGRIINITSAHGHRASRYKSAYVAAKHGLEGLTKATALEAGGHRVTANSIAPGYVLTPLVQGQVADQAKERGISEDEVYDQVFLAKSAVPELPTPEDVAQLALFLCSDAAAAITGSSYSIDGGWLAE